jgi:uncharacterized protein (TIGR02001 family)
MRPKGLICETAAAVGMLNALLAGRSGGCKVVRLLATGIVFTVAIVFVTPRCEGADLWGGSLGIANDYLVRGISRTNDRAALQLDLHYLNDSGFVAGLFASNTEIEPGEPRDVELDAFAGFAWAAGGDWHGKILASYYAYPWNRAGSGYDYGELDIDAAFQDWLNVSVTYSPNAPRFVFNRGLIGVTSTSAELNVQRPVLKRLSATAGAGYAYFEGPPPTGYVYWSVGASYDLAPVSLAVSYVDTTAGAKTLFYNAAAGGRWIATVIWRF